ncbi:hypothetical protein QQS21_003520 [Conoideocrella luteorostrata]|uniref:Uncharacterized protein n=1 Tax=Conoideocrella luteorostrata TaxID=1105319 RepID=A0AAJ0G0I2_9HYPO|nr:hypothetical protein QQS21_003520 [Conoideocrella luteorostrata]
MARSLALLAALAGAAIAAETTTINMIVMGDKSPFVGSVIKADSSATTVHVQCPKNTPSESCGLPPDGATITQGASTWQWNWGFSDSVLGVFTQNANCKLEPAKDLASCTVVKTSASVTQSTQTVESGYSSIMYPVTITDGADKLSAAPGAGATNTIAVSPTASVTSGSGGASKTSAGAAATSTNAAAGPMVTRNAVLAGVAAAVGGVLAL